MEVGVGLGTELARAASDGLKEVDFMEDFPHRWGLVNELENEFLFGKAQFGEGALVGLPVDVIDCC